MEHEDVYHGQNKAEAFKRAREIRGMVIMSIPPEETVASLKPKGYWSGPVGIIRNWETLIHDFSKENR